MTTKIVERSLQQSATRSMSLTAPLEIAKLKECMDEALRSALVQSAASASSDKERPLVKSAKASNILNAFPTDFTYNLSSRSSRRSVFFAPVDLFAMLNSAVFFPPDRNSFNRAFDERF